MKASNPAQFLQCRLLGVDFSSSPTRKKPIAVALGERRGAALDLSALLLLPTLGELQALLTHGTVGAPAERDLNAPPVPFLAAMDMPFGLPRKLVDGLKWPGVGLQGPGAWQASMAYYQALPRDEIRRIFKAWCDARPAGHKFAHRSCDGPAGSSPSMKWVNPPVAFMLHAGVPLLQQAGVHIPGMQVGDSQRVALETYPGYLARQVLGRASYKSDDARKDTADRRMARSELLCAMEEGMLLNLKVNIRPYLRAQMLEDYKGDCLDAALCCMVAAWSAARAEVGFGLPQQLDAIEGWIAPVPANALA